MGGGFTVHLSTCTCSSVHRMTGLRSQGGPKHRGTSRHRGVGWRKKDNRWRAQVWVKARNMSVNLGSFVNEDDAARTFDIAAVHLGFG